jgi:hypothetical protein
MNNIILKGMLEDFATKHCLTGEDEAGLFEKFCNYCVLSNDHYDSFEFDKVETGDAQGVDGVAVVIGDAIIDQIDDAFHFTQTQFSAAFHFIQAKTSQSFSLGDFLKFSATVRCFFQDERAAVPPELQSAFDIKDLIYNRAGKLAALPILKLCYAYTGEFQVADPAVLAAIDSELRALKALNYRFSDVTLKIADGMALAGMYREAQNNTVGRVSFQRHVALPKMERANTAYIGVMKCKDYVGLIKKDNGEINKGLFYENVRDYLGVRNPVNKEIGQTIESGMSRNQFALLNNGVTIVARKVVPSGDTFELHRFQIVNGCQTSHVLYGSEKILSDEMYVTVKLIETSDGDLTNEVIRSTNSQSIVMKEALATTRPYHRVLEDYFYALKDDGFKFLYERRPHQYDDVAGITQDRIVSAPNLMKSFVSVVLEEPHKVHYYYGRLLEEYNTGDASELFSEHHYPGIYYAAHYIVTKVRSHVGRDASLKPWEYHIALLVKRLVCPNLTRETTFTDKTFKEMIARVSSKFELAYVKACKFVREANLARDKNRLPTITSKLLVDFSKLYKAAGSFPGTASTDGDYIGRVEAVDMGRNIIQVRYGTMLMDVPASSESAVVQPGALIRFTRIKGNIVDGKLI